MIFEISKSDKTYKVDDLKPFDQQTKAFQKAFNEAEKIEGDGFTTARFDNAEALLYTHSNRVLIYLKEIENEDN